MIYILLVPVALYLTLILHESTHFCVLKLHGVEILSFKPYPHFDDGRFYFGRVRWFAGPGSKVDWRVSKRSAIAPLLLSIVLGAVWAYVWREYWRYAWVFAASEYLNLAWWLVGFAFNVRGTDGGKWRDGRDE